MTMPLRIQKLNPEAPDRRGFSIFTAVKIGGLFHFDTQDQDAHVSNFYRGKNLNPDQQIPITKEGAAMRFTK